MDQLRKEFNELAEIMRVIESESFQRIIIKPMKEYSQKQKNNFFSDSLKESWRKGGRVEAVTEFFRILDQTKIDFENKKTELENL